LEQHYFLEIVAAFEAFQNGVAAIDKICAFAVVALYGQLLGRFVPIFFTWRDGIVLNTIGFLGAIGFFSYWVGIGWFGAILPIIVFIFVAVVVYTVVYIVVNYIYI
jgi:hypothetical protein